MVAEIAENSDVDLVVTSSISREYGHYDGDGVLRPGDTSAVYLAAWNEFVAAGKNVLVIGDVPQMLLGDIPTCIATKGGSDPCRVTVATALTPDPMLTAVQTAANPSIVAFDPTQFMCSAKWCHSVVGGIPVFADANHLTTAFSRTLAPYTYSSIPQSFLTSG